MYTYQHHIYLKSKPTFALIEYNKTNVLFVTSRAITFTVKHLNFPYSPF